MATNVKKAKKKPVKKNYDSKIVLYLAVGVTALVLILVAAFFIVNISTNYVAKVDGNKIYNYEYEYFASEAINEIGEEIEESLDLADDATTTEKNEAIMAAWTDEKKAEARDLALEKAVEYKVGYLIAKEEGFKLTNTEKKNIKNNVDYYINMYYSYYSSYYSYDQIVAMMCGTLDVAEYKKVALTQNVTEKYRESLKDDYTATEEELRARYDEDPDSYRTVSARVMYLEFGTKPTLSATAPTREDGTAITAELTDITDAEKELLDTYNTAVEEYNKKLEEYNTSVDAIVARAEKIAAALNETGKYSETNDSGEAVYTDADFTTIIKAESKIDSETITNTDGLIKFSSSTKIGVDEIDDFVFTYEYDAERDGIIIVAKPEEKEETEESEETEDGEATKEEAKEDVEEAPAVTEQGKMPTDISVIKAEAGVYLVRCEDIFDFDSEEEAEEGEEAEEDALKNSIQESIRSTIFDEKATEELDKIVEEKIASGKTYTATNKKESRMMDILTEVLGF